MGVVIDLDALTAADRLPRVKLFGREMVVRPLTGAAAHKLAVMQDQDTSPSAMLGPLLDTLSVSVPDLTAEERQQLTVDQMAALLQLSRGQVAEVEAMLTDTAAQVTAGNAVGDPVLTPV